MKEYENKNTYYEVTRLKLLQSCLETKINFLILLFLSGQLFLSKKLLLILWKKYWVAFVLYKTCLSSPH